MQCFSEEKPVSIQQINPLGLAAVQALGVSVSNRFRSGLYSGKGGKGGLPLLEMPVIEILQLNDSYSSEGYIF